VKIRVLGSAAGGGYPQWNCGCDNCQAVRAGKPSTRARTQESVAVSADGVRWFLLNASPEIRAQIESFPGLWPRARRHSPLAGVFLTNGDLDHCLGLLSLRESHPLSLYATEPVRRGFTEGNVLYRTLERFPGHATWTRLLLGEPLALTVDGVAAGLTVKAVPAPGKRPLHLELADPSRPSDEAENVGLVFRDDRTGATLAYFPAVGRPAAAWMAEAEKADLLFVDGTFWSEDELPARGLGPKRAADMAHWPVGGTEGSLAWLASLRGPRRVLIHINNTNPLLREDGPEHAQLRAAGVELAHDGQEIDL